VGDRRIIWLSAGVLILALVALTGSTAAQEQRKHCDLSDADRQRAIAQAAEPLIEARTAIDAMKTAEAACLAMQGLPGFPACKSSARP